MESIKEIESRLQSLDDIKHLLRSVRAMSAIRWRRAKNHLEIAQTYAANVDAQLATVMERTGPRIPGEDPQSEQSQTDRKNVGLITLTSDRGLCGNFNTGLIGKAFQVTEILNRKNKQAKIISLGGYGERLFRNAGYEIFYSEQVPSSQAMSFVNMRNVISHIKAYYLSKAIDELNILYNQFNYFGSYTPQSIQILPPQLDELKGRPGQVDEDLMIKSDPGELKAFLLWEHLTARLYLAFIESTISEHSARLQTMDSAISNLDERVADLEIKYHSIRQERITQGVLEVQSNMRRRKERSRR